MRLDMDGIRREKGKRQIVVVGAGAAGLMAACAAADQGAAVTVLEKTEKAGKKIYITGKGRCNLTNACEMQEFWTHVVTNPKFLYSAVYGFDAQQMISRLPGMQQRKVFPFVPPYLADVHHCPVNSIPSQIIHGRVPNPATCLH